MRGRDSSRQNRNISGLALLRKKSRQNQQPQDPGNLITLLLECGEPHSLDPLGITAESIAARIDSLRITYEQWHTEMKPERQEAILREVFGGSE